MPRVTPISTRPSGHNGGSLPPRGGGGDDGGDGMPDFSPNSIPNSIPNYGERLRRARMGLAVAMTPVIMLFISFTAVYLIRRGFLSLGGNDAAYIRTWVPVRLPWTLLLANTAVLIVSSITIDLARREITREAALAPVQSIPGISLGDERHFPWLALTTVLGLLFLAGQLLIWSKLPPQGFISPAAPAVPSFTFLLPCTAFIWPAAYWHLCSPMSRLYCIARLKPAASSSTLRPGTGIA